MEIRSCNFLHSELTRPPNHYLPQPVSEDKIGAFLKGLRISGRSTKGELRPKLHRYTRHSRDIDSCRYRAATAPRFSFRGACASCNLDANDHVDRSSGVLVFIKELFDRRHLDRRLDIIRLRLDEKGLKLVKCVFDAIFVG